MLLYLFPHPCHPTRQWEGASDTARTRLPAQGSAHVPLWPTQAQAAQIWLAQTEMPKVTGPEVQLLVSLPFSLCCGQKQWPGSHLCHCRGGFQKSSSRGSQPLHIWVCFECSHLRVRKHAAISTQFQQQGCWDCLRRRPISAFCPSLRHGPLSPPQDLHLQTVCLSVSLPASPRLFVFVSVSVSSSSIYSISLSHFIESLKR